MSDPSSSIAPPDLFAAYSPRPDHQTHAPVDLVVRHSAPGDCNALARIAWQRNGGELCEYLQRFERDLAKPADDPAGIWLSAELDRCVVGYGRVFRFKPKEDAPANSAPPGLYLGGVTVLPEFRRRGIGLELTRQRLIWVAQRAGEAYYFASALNRASIDLHARFGFVEITRHFHFPGASFTGGVGILFRIDLRHSHSLFIR